MKTIYSNNYPHILVGYEMIIASEQVRIYYAQCTVVAVKYYPCRDVMAKLGMTLSSAAIHGVYNGCEV